MIAEKYLVSSIKKNISSEVSKGVFKRTEQFQGKWYGLKYHTVYSHTYQWNIIQNIENDPKEN
jgi:hypothetical protein